jgi:hypothetical protein
VRDAIETLTLFVEKAERLKASSLVRTLVERGSRVRISWTAETSLLRVAPTGPSTDEIDAVVLTLRLFMQDKDRISVRNVGKLYESLPVSADLKKYYEMQRLNLNKYLDNRALINIGGDRPTKREILETFLYGELAHLDEAKRQRYRTWVANPIAACMIEFEFVRVLHRFLRTLSVMAQIHQQALAELKAAPDAPTPAPSGNGE